MIIGTCGCGKTTLGEHLASKLHLPLTELDDLFWLPLWKKCPHQIFIQSIEQVTKKNAWIICGNYSKCRPLIWPKADTIVWLDLPLYTLFGRILKRGLLQMETKEIICNGNRQTFLKFLWILYWVLKTFYRRRRVYSRLIKQHSHLHWIHLKSKEEVEMFYANPDVFFKTAKL